MIILPVDAVAIWHVFADRRIQGALCHPHCARKIIRVGDVSHLFEGDRTLEREPANLTRERGIVHLVGRGIPLPDSNPRSLSGYPQPFSIFLHESSSTNQSGLM